jgi:starch synthase (maltosyl-transferring)
VRFHDADSDQILVWSKQLPQKDGTADTVLTVLNLDSHGVREATVRLDLPALGLDWGDTVEIHDEVSGADYTWGEANYVRLDPFVEPAHIFTVRRSS